MGNTKLFLVSSFPIETSPSSIYFYPIIVSSLFLEFHLRVKIFELDIAQLLL